MIVMNGRELSKLFHARDVEDKSEVNGNVVDLFSCRPPFYFFFG